MFTFILGVFVIIFYYSLSSLLKGEYLKIKNTYTKDNKYLAVINGNGLWIKDTIGDKINIINANKINNEFLSEGVYITSKALSGIDFRSDNLESLDNLEKNSIDFYASLRSLYLQDRENKIKNNQRGRVEVIYEDEQDWEEIDNK